jgi:PLP dependent protein
MASALSQQIQANLATVLKLIQKSCILAGRDQHEVTLIAVSKGHDFSAIQAAYELGQRHFGESYAQEMTEKIAQAHHQGLADITWHFIGAIQSNKLKAISKADVIHSLGTTKHAQLLNDVAEKTLPVFLQVNLGQEPKRQGFSPADLALATGFIRQLDFITLKGLMCIPPQDPTKTPRFWFQKMIELKLLLEQKLTTNLALSMGMSDDFTDAIAMGADYVRVGTRIFGGRD